MGELGDAEPLLALPSAPFPATIEVNAVVDHQASVAYRDNRYSVPPGLAGMTMCLRQRLGTTSLDVLSPAGVCLVTHPLAAPGSGAMVRSVAHKEALSSAVLSAFTSARPCDRKANRPPGPGALAERAKLVGPEAATPAVDLAAMAEIVELASSERSGVAQDEAHGEEGRP